jgi:hypothetical protein
MTSRKTFADNSTKSSLQYFVYFLPSNCSQNRVESLKRGQKLVNALEFQSKVHNAVKARDESPFIRTLPKRYPLPKSLDFKQLETINKASPVQYLNTEEISQSEASSLTPAMQEYVRSRNFSTKLEYKKTENLEAFFMVILI